MKPLHWIASSLQDVREFPEEVRQEVGYSIDIAQRGGKATNAVPLVGFRSAKVLEVIVDADRATYRAVYTVKLEHAVYVLHAFQKKSKKGIATPQQDILLIRSRLKTAESHHRAIYESSRRSKANERGA